MKQKFSTTKLFRNDDSEKKQRKNRNSKSGSKAETEFKPGKNYRTRYTCLLVLMFVFPSSYGYKLSKKNPQIWLSVE